MSHVRMLERDRKLADWVLNTPSIAIVDITDAANWYWAESDQDYWDIHDDLYRLTAPSGSCWLEYKCPSRIKVHGGIIPWSFPIQRFGAFVTCLEIPKNERPQAVFSDYLNTTFCMLATGKGGDWESLYMQNFNTTKHREVLAQMRESMATPPAFVLSLQVFVQISNWIHQDTLWAAYLDEEGRAYSSSVRGAITAISPPLARASILGILDDETYRKIGVSSSVVPFCFALSLMNCRNVTQVDKASDLTRNERRRLVRQNISPVLYKWLTIKQLQRQTERDGSLSSSGPRKRLHQVRSHWAVYSPDAPLFGKYPGAFFIPQHVRGSAEIGTVVKGYNLLKSKQVAGPP